MTTQLNLGRDVQGFNAYAPDFADINYNTILAANIEQHFTVPSNVSRWIAVFSFTPGASVWASNLDTAVIPTGSFAASLSQLNPATRTVKAGDVLSFISDDTAEVGVSLYAVSI